MSRSALIAQKRIGNCQIDIADFRGPWQNLRDGIRIAETCRPKRSIRARKRRLFRPLGDSLPGRLRTARRHTPGDSAGGASSNHADNAGRRENRG